MLALVKMYINFLVNKLDWLDYQEDTRGSRTTDPNVASGCSYWANTATDYDTCASLTDYFGLTIADLVSWNPSLSTTSCTLTPGRSNKFYFVKSGDGCAAIATAKGSDCRTLIADYYVCVEVTGSSTKTTAPTTTTTAAANTPQQSGIAKNCNKHYFVKSGDGCAAIASANGISLADFYSWNPAVGSDCRTLIADYYVCVGVSSSTTTTKKTTTTTTKSATTAGTGPSPTQSGITTDCNTFYKAVSGDSYYTIVTNKYTYLSLAQLIWWNPAVGGICASLQVGYYYCVATNALQPMPGTNTATCKK
ncbi:LysM peptidoglycan-binding domain-containing protein [Aspergillus affinis]|uniref:LysM peptidoglycan-binding domain-containing protein n=1 Tax=Aspergillus affinis TaxID=1070780 RepID=UPI0022FF30E9|nr:LysM domain protein [Aspergillus affinis]KAI9044908.1 LysM domain protein [Aspergillus affinis]